MFFLIDNTKCLISEFVLKISVWWRFHLFYSRSVNVLRVINDISVVNYWIEEGRTECYVIDIFLAENRSQMSDPILPPKNRLN